MLPYVCASALILLLAGPLGTRIGLWRFPLGFALLAAGLLLAAFAFVLAVVRVWSGRGLPDALVVVAIVAAAAVPLWQMLSAARLPAIHDITTDTEDPPAFDVLTALRGADASPAAYDGADTAARQRQAYPDIAPIALDVPSAEAFDRALAAAQRLGLAVVAADRTGGRIEAVATTAWFGFKDDIVVRVRASNNGSRIDVRSKSRMGRGDMGANARRIRRFADLLRNPT